jgi:hypothetical protein
LVYADPSGLQWYKKNDGSEYKWFDNSPGEGWTGIGGGVEHFTYYAGEEHGYVALDPHSANWVDGFEDESEAAGAVTSFGLAFDPATDGGLFDSTMEMMGFIPPFGIRGAVGRGITRGAVREGIEDTAVRAIPQVILNRIAGREAERIVAGQLAQEGSTILGSQVAVRTSAGLRFIDHLITTPGGQMIAVEVKSGNAVRSARQLMKDGLIATDGAVVVGRNAPKGLQGQRIVIQTIERRVP